MAEENRPDFSKLVDALKRQNDEANVAREEAKVSAQLSAALQNSSAEIELDQVKAIEELIETLNAGKLSELEDRKEANKMAKDTLALLGNIAENTEPENEVVEFEGIGQAGIGFVAALGAALSGLVVGIIAGLAGQIKVITKFIGRGLRRTFGGFFRSLTKPFANLSKSSKGFLKPALDFFKNIGRAFKAGFGGLKTFRATTGRFAKLGFFGTIGKTLGNGFRAIQSFGNTLSGFGKSVAGLGKTLAGAKFLNIAAPFKTFFNGIKSLKAAFLPVKSAGGLFSGVKKFLSPIGKIAKTVFNVFKAFGRIIGRLIIPLQIIFGAIDGVKGFINGFKNQEGSFFSKLTSGIIGAVSGILQGLIGIPLDLLKKAVSFIAGKLGFSSFAEKLEAFSFKKLIGNIFDGLNNIWQGIIDFFANMFSAEGRAKNMERLGNIAGGINDFIKKILRAILPDPDAERGLFDPRGLVAKAIPASVYRYAGLDPDTGDVLPTGPDLMETIVGDDSNLRGAEMDMNSRENTAAGDQGTGDVAVVTDNSNNQNIKQGDNVFVNMNNATFDPNLTPSYS